jgi:DNA-binding NarL/FixJ family response regulator
MSVEKVQSVNVIRLLLVEDHEVVRAGLRMILERKGNIEVVGEAGTLVGAVAEAGRLKPEVILMDIRLPDGSGVEMCHRIQAVSPDSRLIFLTSFPDEQAVVAAVVGGACGYLLKEVRPEALVRAIHEVAQGRSVLDPAVTQPLLNKFRGLTPPGHKQDLDVLTHQQEKVLALVADGKINKEIAEELGLSEKTVKNYVRNIFQRLQITRRSQAAVYYVKSRRGSN